MRCDNVNLFFSWTQDCLVSYSSKLDKQADFKIIVHPPLITWIQSSSQLSHSQLFMYLSIYNQVKNTEGIWLEPTILCLVVLCWSSEDTEKILVANVECQFNVCQQFLFTTTVYGYIYKMYKISSSFLLLFPPTLL